MQDQCASSTNQLHANRRFMSRTIQNTTGAVKQQRPFIVGLTGGIASGKSTVSQEFAALGVTIIDADIVARSIVTAPSDTLDKIVAHFGSEVRLANGELNRAQLRNYIFSDPDARVWLNALMHPQIEAVIEQQIAVHSNEPYLLLVIPLLAESGKYTMIDFTLVVDCRPECQKERLIQRDHIDAALAQQIIDAQATRAQRLAIADGIISTDATLAQTLHQVASWHQQFSTNDKALLLS